MITINMNQQRLQVGAKTTIYQFLQQIDSSVSGVAVAINDQVVPRSHWETRSLQDDDTVLIIQAAQGG
ncbi:sulfur carrier protein ThiS [Zobellia uliginosa]|uniref:Sulfur carrier protein ThiS n=1 Tax=Zobellia uliginosa TaxID=143224 RepID=A0ABY1KM91_9FLAO|nr:sulfur carrier protein ThiS [Zobellia uliginosa]SIS49383.1 sulfur carrier protein ThiS [Zobellia uliginosa]